MVTFAELIAEAKRRKGDARMSDAALAIKLGRWSGSAISNAKRGAATDPLALAIAEACGRDAGEVVMVARLERERDPGVRSALLRYMGKIERLAASVAKAGIAALVLCGALAAPRDALALGGVGRFRRGAA